MTDGAVRTIEAGTLILAGIETSLVVLPESQLVTEGTAQEPVVFTSDELGDRYAGDWGGIVLLGEAEINAEGGQAPALGANPALPSSYGGTDDDGSRGSLRYTRIEFGGWENCLDEVLPALTVAGC